MQPQTVSKSQFKPQALKYIRQVEKTGQSLTITHWGKPTVKLVPANPKTDQEILDSLKGTVEILVSEEEFLEPIGVEDWEALK